MNDIRLPENVIEIEGLNKNFGEIKAVRDLSFCVKKGELFAFLGVNGAGKSTTINVLCGTLTANSGTVKIDGVDAIKNPDAAKTKLGVVFQTSLLDGALSVYDNLQSRAALYGITGTAFQEKLTALAKTLHFSDLLKRTVGKLSGGQRRRIDIARALLHDPEILILDEPTTGLDPQTRRTIWETVSSLQKNRGMTVFLTTHYMEEAAEADYVIILDSGSIAAKGTPLELKNAYAGDYITLYGVAEEDLAPLALPYEKVRDGYRLSVSGTAKATEIILAHPSLFKDYEITKGKMDDVFLSVTGKKLTEEDQ